MNRGTALSLADSEGIRLNLLHPTPFYLTSHKKEKKIGLSETKSFHFHGISKQIEIKSAKRPPHAHIFIHVHIDPLSRNLGSAPTYAGYLKPRSHEGLGPCCDLCKTSHVVKSQVDLIRARDRS